MRRPSATCSARAWCSTSSSPTRSSGRSRPRSTRSRSRSPPTRSAASLTSAPSASRSAASARWRPSAATISPASASGRCLPAHSRTSLPPPSPACCCKSTTVHWIDWTLLLVFLVWIVFDGLRRTKDSHELDGYLLAKRSIPWWAAGISVMATQLSAITMIGTTGQGYEDGMRFVQFYFGLPVAMIILSVTLVPFFYNSGVYTAYEYLEKRFDPKTRTFTSLLFLLSRGMSCGAVVAAPA